MENSELKYHLEQFKVLKGQGYKYIAGAEHGGLRAYRQIPIRQINFWYATSERPHPIDLRSFDEVDRLNKPLNILSEIKCIKKALKG
ncbi:MAG: hypothetical protein HFE82_06715 [Erysipelotrichaceae bacterium]|nr:hypothetical protein [Erysipelotrichaceae bacterium]